MIIRVVESTLTTKIEVFTKNCKDFFYFSNIFMICLEVKNKLIILAVHFKLYRYAKC